MIHSLLHNSFIFSHLVIEPFISMQFLYMIHSWLICVHVILKHDSCMFTRFIYVHVIHTRNSRFYIMHLSSCDSMYDLFQYFLYMIC